MHRLLNAWAGAWSWWGNLYFVAQVSCYLAWSAKARRLLAFIEFNRRFNTALDALLKRIASLLNTGQKGSQT